jgi:SAM-dependent methyltransferase
MADVSLPRIYGELAHLWPVVTPPDQYTWEATELKTHIDSVFGPSPKAPLDLLELGVGGGHTLSHFGQGFRVTGLDLSPSMLDNCARLVPHASFVCGDLRHARLGQQFDIVLLQDAADYLLTLDDLRDALRTVAVHLRPGGLALVAPTYVVETFVPHETVHDQRASDDGALIVSYLSYVHDPDPSDQSFEMVTAYLINQAGSVRVVEDRHTCGLFTRPVWIQPLRHAGLDPTAHEHEVWTLFVARHG